MSEFQYANVSTSLDPPQGICLYLRRDGDGYMITDLIGKRYGWGLTILHAVEMWASDVEGLCTEPSEQLGDPLLSEQRAYRSALKRGATEATDS